MEGRAQLVDVAARLPVEAQLDGVVDRVVLVDDGHVGPARLVQLVIRVEAAQRADDRVVLALIGAVVVAGAAMSGVLISWVALGRCGGGGDGDPAGEA